MVLIDLPGHADITDELGSYLSALRYVISQNLADVISISECVPEVGSALSK